MLLVAGLVRVKSTVSPSRTRTVLPGTVPSNVHAVRMTLPALSTGSSVSIAFMATFTVFASACCIGIRPSAATGNIHIQFDLRIMHLRL